MSEEIFERIKSFIIKITCIRDILLNRDTILQTEIGVKGDDAVELIEAFSEEFNVDVSNFYISKYFEGEGDTTISDFIDWIRGKEKEPIKPLTLSDLEKAVIAGKLDETVIGSKF
jgi:hypothetical protein